MSPRACCSVPWFQSYAPSSPATHWALFSSKRPRMSSEQGPLSIYYLSTELQYCSILISLFSTYICIVIVVLSLVANLKIRIFSTSGGRIEKMITSIDADSPTLVFGVEAHFSIFWSISTLRIFSPKRTT